MKKIAAFLSFLLLLGGCAQDQPTAETIQEHFDALPGFTAHVKIISDFDESVLEYEVDYAYNRKGSDHLTLTAPESVRGIEATIDGEERILLRYGGAELDDGTPGLQGTTPADGVYWVLRELRESEPLEIWPESVSGTPALAVRYAWRHKGSCGGCSGCCEKCGKNGCASRTAEKQPPPPKNQS